MLKLLLNHWQVHHEPAPFILTDDPLYCTHITASTKQLPEVYSVNRINPIFEEDEGEHEGNYTYHKTALSENETSEDTGYTSGHRHNQKGLTDDTYSLEQTLSTDSDEPSKSVTVSADVHRVSHPDDIIVLSSTSSCSLCASSLSIHSGDSSSQEPYDSLTASNVTPPSSRNPSVFESMKVGVTDSSALQTEVKRPATSSSMNARDKIERLLQHGNQSSPSDSAESQESGGKKDRGENFEKTRAALMKSLTRAIVQKVPKTPTGSTEGTEGSITRTDSTTTREKRKASSSNEGKEASGSGSKETESKATADEGDAVTRKDESVSSNSDSTSASRKRHHHRHNHHRDKHRDDGHKPRLTLHQLLPGHWSYDNIYLPQMPGPICYHCLPHHHHHNGQYPFAHLPSPDAFYPVLNQKSRSRHSWAPKSTPPPTQTSSERRSSSSKEGSNSDRRYSPDGSSHETESDSQAEKLRQDMPERRSLRVPKKCKCDICLSTAFDNEGGVFPHFAAVPHCTCCYMPHRKVKFASDTDLSIHHHHHHDSPDGNSQTDDASKHDTMGRSDSPTFHINLHRLNGHANEKSQALSGEGKKSKHSSESTVSRGQKEPIKMEDLYRSYPMNFKDWEAHYRRKFLHKRRKRALNMIGMAIGIILVVGVAIAVTFIFLRMKRPT